MTCRVLVTGVSGFVGGALGKFLRAAGGYRVTGVSRSPARTGAADEFIAHDLTAPIPGDWPGHDVVVHCAALSSPWASPAAYRLQNAGATANVLEYASRSRGRGCPRLIFVSSSSVHYRHGDQLGITELTPLPEIPINGYAATKRAAEGLIRAASPAGLSSAILRPRAVFGPGDSVLFPRLLRAAERGVLPRFRRPDGVSPQGDLLYIDNLTHFIERAIATGAEGTFNLTNGEPVDLIAFLDAIFIALGSPRIKRSLPVGAAFALARFMEGASRWFFNYREPPITRFGVEVMAYSKTFDVAKASAAFGPAPVSNAAGMARFVEWQRSQPR